MLLQRLLPAPKPIPSSQAGHLPQSQSQSQQEEEEEIEDLFSDSLSLLFPDDVRNQHGLPGSRLVYRSPAYGDIDLLLADPTQQDDRLLFAHYLWNAALVLADLIETDADCVRGGCGGGRCVGGERGGCEGGGGGGGGGRWRVQGKRVVEIGAGMAMLLSIPFFCFPCNVRYIRAKQSFSR